MQSLLDSIHADLYAEALEVIRTDRQIAEILSIAEESSYCNFRPRPDKPEEFDQQQSFCENRDIVSFLIGGNAAGTTEAAAYKTAQFLLRHQPPTRRDLPFWILSNTYDLVTDVCWVEKLYGNGHIPSSEIDWARVRWRSPKSGQPYTVPLKPWPTERGGDPNKNWVIEFKSYDQGRAALQAMSIGGFWFSEQFPISLFLAPLRGCRECMFPGGQFAEFTPVDPVLCMWIEEIIDETPEGWAFYRANTASNRPNLAADWYDNFVAAIPDEMRETRLTGALASFEGVIFQSFNRAVHVFEGAVDFPPGVMHYLGHDWGASEEHPFTTVWGYRDGMGDWTVYDEYWSVDQGAITLDKARAVAERSIDWGWPGKWDETRDGGGFVREDHPNYSQGYGDPSRPDMINEFNCRGLTCGGASNAVFKGIDCIRSLLKVQPTTDKPRLRIHSRCKHLIEELRKYRWKRGRRPTEGLLLNPQVAKPEPLKRDDDTVDALRYMIYSVEAGYGAVPGSTSYRDYERRHGVQIQRTGRARR